MKKLKGEAFLAKGYFDLAENIFSAILNLDRDNTHALNNLGTIFLCKSEFKESEQYLLNALTKDGLKQDTIKKLIYLYHKTGETSKANSYKEMLLKFYTSSEASLNRKEKNSEFYNDVYRTGGWQKEYHKHYTDSNNHKAWGKVVSWIMEVPERKIIEIGCGSGQLSNMLFDNGLCDYKGIDFSSTAIALAKDRNPKYAHLFSVENAFDTDLFSGAYTTVVILEVLEHIEDDLNLLKRIKESAQVIFSIPNFDSRAHVRWFENEEKIIQRYSEIVDILSIHEVTYANTSNKIYLLNCLKGS